VRLKLEQDGRVVRVRLHRPEVLNALDTELMTELVDALTPLDRDPDVGCFVITGSDRVFAAGADIKEMAEKSTADMIGEDYFAGWEAFAALRTPKIAAVAGYALGGGCELAMMCDVIIAADNAKFGQPEITLGVIPGIGGTQRLTRLVGRDDAGDEADRLLAEANAVAEQIAGYGKLAVTAASDCVDRALETGLSDGIRYERRVFHGLFATKDQKEGMRAFREKRPPTFTGQ
jgi:enoyl-CoA hydratase